MYVYWSHWRFSSTSGWYYDPDGGKIEFVENLSTPGCPIFCDKYDTHCCNANLNMNRDYPPKALSSALSDAELPASPDDSVGNEVLSSALGAPTGDRKYSVNVTQDGDAHLVADLDDGLVAYRRAAWGLANRTVAEGPADGVITFTRPLSWQEVTNLEATGVRIDQIEVVSEPDAAGLRWTFAVTNRPSAAAFVEEAAAEAQVRVLGVVSANVTVPSVKVLHQLASHEAVYLVDLSVADFESANPGVEAIQNDVFWTLQGWD